MKENVIDILVYLLEHAPIEEDVFQHDQESLKSFLMDAGFASLEIHAAFRWLDDLDLQISEQFHRPPTDSAIRQFSATEAQILDTECQGYLIELANAGILSYKSFELVVDRLIALGNDQIELDDLEWVVLIVLSNQKDEQAAFERLGSMRMHEPNTLLN